MCPHVSGTERVVFSKQDACGNLVVASLPLNFPFSAFCGRCLLWTSVWTEHDSYLSFSQKSSSWHFLALAKLRSTAREWNHQRISKLVNRLIVTCLLTASLRFAPRQKCGPSSLRMLRSGIFNVPMPYGIYCLSHDSFLCASLQGDSVYLPCYNALQRDLQPA